MLLFHLRHLRHLRRECSSSHTEKPPVSIFSSDVSVHWGDDSSSVFTQNINGSFSPSAGIHDSLVQNGGTWTLTKPDQTVYQFNSAGYCTSLTDPLSRTWSLSYDGNGDLVTLTSPTVGGSSYTTNLTYN